MSVNSPWITCGRPSYIYSIKEVIEGTSLDRVTNLVQRDLLGVDQTHCVLQIQVTLAIDVKAHCVIVEKTAVNRIKDWSLSDLLGAEVPEEEVQVRGDVCLRRVFNNAIAVLGIGREARRELVESAETPRSDLGVTVLKLLDDVAFWKVLSELG